MAIIRDEVSGKNPFGYIRVGAVEMNPERKTPAQNAVEIVRTAKEALKQGVQILAFPRLSLAGYTFKDAGSDEYIEALKFVCEKTKDDGILLIVGAPLKISGCFFDCGVAIYSGTPVAAVPGTYISGSEMRFSSGAKTQDGTIDLWGIKVPFGKKIIYSEQIKAGIGIEIGQDLCGVVPPSCRMVLSGADIIINLSSKTNEDKIELAIHQSARCICGYILSSNNGSAIAENGHEISFKEYSYGDKRAVFSDLDLKRISKERKGSAGFNNHEQDTRDSYNYGKVNMRSKFPLTDMENASLYRNIPKNPFLPTEKEQAQSIIDEIMDIQCAGLAKRLEHTGIKKTVIGVSGGVDSTLALLISCRTFDMLKLPRKNIIGVSMPGFGTTKATCDNAAELMETLGIRKIETDIKEACMLHFRDIGHDPGIKDVTYENAQARERTQILMDIANKEEALVIGTGDLSETALGWCTYNGDHMSMYSVNSSVPKTLIQHLIERVCGTMEENARSLLKRILKTPVSPELLPPDETGGISQKTESILGPYELHDFFLYYFVYYNDSPEKILFLAKTAFSGIYTEEEIKKTLRIFLSRFFSQQFKRSCMPDGPKTGAVSLSPRGDWKMPSDAVMSSWEI